MRVGSVNPIVKAQPNPFEGWKGQLKLPSQPVNQKITVNHIQTITKTKNPTISTPRVSQLKETAATEEVKKPPQPIEEPSEKIVMSPKPRLGVLTYTKIEDYKFGRTLGQGAYATVKECVYKNSGKTVAIKQYDRAKLDDKQRKKQLHKEIRVLSRLNHPNIVKLYEVIDSKTHVNLVMEFCHGDSLHNHLKQ